MDDIRRGEIFYIARGGGDEREQDAAVYVEENRKVDASRQSEDIIKVQTERDTFKALYEQLFERLLTMGGTGN